MNTDLEGSVYPGELFKQLVGYEGYLILVDDDDKADFNTYIKSGIMEENLSITTNSFVHGGIKFMDINNFWKTILHYEKDKYTHYYEVEVLDNSQVYIDKNKYSTDTLFVMDKKSLYDLPIWGISDICLEIYNEKPFLLKYMKLSDDDYIELIKKKPSIFEDIYNPFIPTSEKVCIMALSEKVCIMALSENGMLIKKINTQTLQMCRVAVENNVKAFEFCQYQDDEMVSNLLRKNGMLLNFVFQQTEEMVRIAIDNNPAAIRYARIQPEDVCVGVIEKNPHLLQFIINQTDEIINLALYQSMDTFKHIKNKTRKLSLEMMKHNGMFLEFVDDQTDEICWQAIKQNYRAIKFCKLQIEEMCRFVLDKDPDMLEYCQFQPEDICIEYIKKYPYLFKFIKPKNQTLKICEISFDNNKKNFKYTKYQSSKMCYTAIEDEWENLEYVINQTLELCKFACCLNIKAIKFAKFQDEEICFEAISKDPDLIQYVINQTENLMMIAVSKNPPSYKYIKEPTEKVSIIFVEFNGKFLEDVVNQTTKIIVAAVSNFPYAIKYAQFQNEEIHIAVLNKSIHFFDELVNPTNKVYMIAVKKHGLNIKHIQKENQTEELCYEAVNDMANAFEFCFIQTDKVCKTALEKDGNMLKHIINQTYEYCKIAVNNDYRALKYVLDDLKNDELDEIAFKNDVNAIEFMSKQPEDKCIEAIRKYSYIVRDIKEENLTPTVSYEACKKDYWALNHLKKTPENCMFGIACDRRAMNYVPEMSNEWYLHAILVNPKIHEDIKKKNNKIGDYITESDIGLEMERLIKEDKELNELYNGSINDNNNISITEEYQALYENKNNENNESDKEDYSFLGDAFANFDKKSDQFVDYSIDNDMENVEDELKNDNVPEDWEQYYNKDFQGFYGFT
jgi:hypothetical protein